ncbi:MAG: TolC family protein [Labilithrix sp.]|nr:TolC family protein [Labilithrix sp.]MCW5810535.1 TolC family protein [Labilithrix sp.]
MVLPAGGRSSLLALTVVLASGSAQAAPETSETSAPSEAGPRAVTLEEALALARKDHPSIAAARLRVVAAARDADVPAANWLPRAGAFAQVVGASVNNSTTTQIGVATVDIPRIGATLLREDPSFHLYPSTMLALGVRQQIYDFGRTAAEQAAAALATEVEKARAAGTLLDVDFFVAQAHYAVLAARAVDDAAKNAFDRAASQRDFARANVTSGMRPPIELTRAEADVARYEAGMMRARGALRVARSVLAAAVGAGDIELDAAGAPQPAGPLPALADLLRRAEKTPLVREANARVAAQRGETKRLETQTRPTVFGTAAVNGRGGGAPPNAGPELTGDGWVPLVPNYDLGVVLAWPILEPAWSRRADASRERELALDAETRRVVIEQRAAIATAWQDADVATSALTALERGADAAKANYDQADNRFRVGLGTSTELADAQALRTESEIQLAIGRFQSDRARLVLARATAEAK